MIARTFRLRLFTASSLGGAVVALAVACGDDPGAPSSTPDASSPEASTTDGVAPTDAPPPADGDLEAFCKGTLGLYAVHYEECCDPAAAPKKYTFDHTLLGALLPACTMALGRSIDMGRATFVPAAAATCETNTNAFVLARSCPDVLHSPNNQPATSIFKDLPGCPEAIVGKQGADAPCSNDYECVDGLTCIGWTPDSDGTCKPPPGEGALCGYAIPDSGAFADLVRWGFGTHPRCAPGLYCASTATQQGTCKPVKLADASCDSDDECAEGLRCQLGQCGTAGPAPAGEPCVRTSDCQDRLYCKSVDGGHLCAPREVAGAPCSNGFSSECQGACVTPDGGGQPSCVAYCGSQ